jgi:hypothetical protein
MSIQKALISAVISVPLFCAGCLYVPNLSHVVGPRAPDEKTVSSIKEGVTSEEDILLMFGEPDRAMENEKFFQYWWHEDLGEFVMLGLPPEGSRSEAVVMRMYSLLIYFDENNIVRKFEIKTTGKFVTFNPRANTADQFLFELYAGNYVEMEVPSPSEIELKKNGKGVWKTLGKETPFKWSMGDNGIRVDIKSELIICHIEDNILEILQPVDLKGKCFKRITDSDSP